MLSIASSRSLAQLPTLPAFLWMCHPSEDNKAYTCQLLNSMIYAGKDALLPQVAG